MARARQGNVFENMNAVTITKARPRAKSLRFARTDATASHDPTWDQDASGQWSWHRCGSERCEDGVWRQRVEAIGRRG